MSLMQTELYDALKASGSPEEAAREAAKEAAALDVRLHVIAERVNAGDTLRNWMAGVIVTLLVLTLGGVLATLWRGFHP